MAESETALDVTTRAHALACGTLCTEGADGCCTNCGASMGDRCPECLCVAYHDPCCGECESD